MASTYQVKVHWYDERSVISSIPVTSATVVAVGDMVAVESNELTLVDAAANDSVFCGIALGISAAGETAAIPVAVGDVIGDVTVASAAYRFGAGLTASTDGSFADDAGANTICFVISDNTSADTTATVRFNATELKKYYAISA